MSYDVYVNNASLTTASSAGTTAPGQLATEVWSTVSLSSTWLALGADQVYRIVDMSQGASLAQKAEIILVTACTGPAATSVTVMRGVEGTTPVAHGAGATYAVALTKASLESLVTFRIVRHGNNPAVVRPLSTDVVYWVGDIAPGNSLQGDLWNDTGNNVITPAGSGGVPPITVPGAPATPAAAAGDQRVVVTWTPPSVTGGSPITNYDVLNVGTGQVTTVANVLTATILNLTNGTAYTFQVRARNTVGLGAYSQTSAAVTPVAAGGGTEFSAYSANPTPSLETSNANPYEIGVKFRVSQTATCVGIRFYKGSNVASTHALTLWSATGTALATVTSSGEATTGWIRTDFATPYALAADTTYVASYNKPASEQYAKVTAGLTNAVAQGPLTLLADGVDGGNAVYHSGGAGFPSESYGAENFYVDPVISTAAYTPPPAPTTAPTLSGTAGNTQVTLNWTTVTNATGYNLKRGTSTVYTGANLAYTDTGLTNGTAYSYTVNAYNPQGQGPYSSALSRTPAGTGGSGVLPAKIVGAWWQRWQGPVVSEVAARPQYNYLSAGPCQGNGSGGGGVTFGPDFQGDATFIPDVAAWKAAGRIFLVMVGGGGDGNIHVTNETQATEMYNSLVPIIDKYGFQGVDWDLESGNPGGWTTSALVSTCQKLKNHYGASFIIAAAPRPFEDYYRTWAVAMGSLLDLFVYQFYSYPEAANYNFQQSYIDSRFSEAVGLGIPASKLMIGCYIVGNQTSPPEWYRDAFNTQVAKYPTLRGTVLWEASADKSLGWPYATMMGAAVRGL